MRGSNMALKLEATLGKPQTFHYGQKPWHGVGTALNRPATAAKAIEAAGLDWKVKTESLYLKGEVHVGDYQAIVREVRDTKHVFGITSDRYVPIQNRDSFTFFDPIVQAGKATYHAAGAVGFGEQVWLLVKLPGELKVLGKDRVEKYLLLMNSHTGKQALRMLFTPVRVACENTLITALDGTTASEGMFVRHHVGDITSKEAEAKRLLEIAAKYYDQLLPIFNAMARRPVTQAEATAYITRLIPTPSGRGPSTRTENIRRALNVLFHTGAGNSEPGIKGTLWALYNAVTEFVTHKRTTRPTLTTDSGPEMDEVSARLTSAWFGSGARLSVKAFQEARAMLKG